MTDQITAHKGATDKILITSALPYINGIKHLGNLCGSLLPADVYARYNRLRGRDVLFVCGTDEHGTPAELAAAAARQPVDAFCAEQHAIQADIYQRFGLSFDRFGRTSGTANHALTQAFYHRLDAAGLIEERVVRQIWSDTDHRFLPDRYVVGTCPHCGYEKARGDQCDGCTRLLDPTDLKNARSAVSGATDLEVRETKHLFLRQSALADALRAWIDGKSDWDPLVTSIARKWLDEGLGDRCITRDLAWGVPVPRPGFEEKVFYVWFDAPIYYFAAVQEWAAERGSDWRDWVRPGDGTRLVQFLAKDNVPFHTLTFPATVIGADAGVRLVDRIKGFHWLTYGGRKFSTSEGRGIFTDAALQEFPADIWRWWLTANAPESGDVRFTFPVFADGVNADLADTIGNLVNRVLKFGEARFGAVVPEGLPPGDAEHRLADRASVLVASITENFEAIRLRRAAADIRALWALGNEYLTEQAPWTTIKTDPAAAARTLQAAIGLITLAATLSSPIIPEITARVLTAFGEPAPTAWPDATPEAVEDRLAPPVGGRALTPLAPLFAKITPEWVADLEARYGAC